MTTDMDGDGEGSLLVEERGGDDADATADESRSDVFDLFADDEPPPEDPVERERRERFVRRTVDWLVVVACALYVFANLHPTDILSSAVPSGGDMGAHVWGPAFLRDHLLPAGRISGWTPDWYAGFPAYQFYMVVPSLLIVALDVGVFGGWTMIIPLRGGRLHRAGERPRVGLAAVGARRRGGRGGGGRRGAPVRDGVQARDGPGRGHAPALRLRLRPAGRPALPRPGAALRGIGALPVRPQLHDLRRQRRLHARG